MRVPCADAYPFRGTGPSARAPAIGASAHGIGATRHCTHVEEYQNADGVSFKRIANQRYFCFQTNVSALRNIS
jgi:hypothetical protein